MKPYGQRCAERSSAMREKNEAEIQRELGNESESESLSSALPSLEFSETSSGLIVNSPFLPKLA